MATGVEIRVPLLDREIVEVAARIPSRFKQRGNIGKYVFKKAMEGLLPNDIIYRKKTGFGVPLRKWLKGPLQPLIDSLLASDTIKSRGIFDFDGMQRLRKMDNEGSVDASYSILAAACIELWCQIFLDGTTSGHT